MVPHGVYTLSKPKMINTAPSAKKRFKILEEVYKKGKTVASVCRRNKISRTVFYKWAKKYDKKLSKRENIKYLRSKKRKVSKSPKKASTEMVEKVKEIAAKEPHLSKYKIVKPQNKSAITSITNSQNTIV